MMADRPNDIGSTYRGFAAHLQPKSSGSDASTSARSVTAAQPVPLANARRDGR
jgi:hypothetical protein